MSAASCVTARNMGCYCPHLYLSVSTLLGSWWANMFYLSSFDMNSIPMKRCPLCWTFGACNFSFGLSKCAKEGHHDHSMVLMKWFMVLLVFGLSLNLSNPILCSGALSNSFSNSTMKWIVWDVTRLTRDTASRPIRRTVVVIDCGAKMSCLMAMRIRPFIFQKIVRFICIK